MALEVLAAALLGGMVLWIILHPLYRPEAAGPAFEEPEDFEETKRGIALLALKEIDFDRATGKLSDSDHELLKRKYTVEALLALREAEEAAPAAAVDDVIERLVEVRVAGLRGAPAVAPAGALTCLRCGPRPEPDARFCSACGDPLLGGGACAICRHPLDPGSRYCGNCGSAVTA